MDIFTHFFIHNLDIVATLILIATLFPVVKLIRELPTGLLQKRWRILIGFISFFILAYIFLSLQFRLELNSLNRELICLVLFFGAIFVYMVSIMSLKTALDVKRIYTLEIESMTDPLMGISNRRHLDEKLANEFSKATRYDLPLSAFMIDIDHFKDVNDTYGHDVGDVVLKNIAALIKQTIRETDFVARYGGEEIVVLLPLANSQNAMFLAERLRNKIQDFVISVKSVQENSLELSITVSIGVATRTVKTTKAEELIKDADEAMYQAKNSGRNRVMLSEKLV
ncbi:MAG: GGDEF domain-containing protein [Sulfurimonas sp.]|nr:GGDEF domain-containing protein [Sulfurimonas sp.]